MADLATVALRTLFCLLAIQVTSTARADELAVARQSTDDAWWTGPLLAASPATLPQGHVLFEPYFYDAIVDRRFDSSGDRHAAAHADGFGSQSYLLYGLTDSTTVGLIPRFGYNDPREGSTSSGVGVGDLTLQASFRLTQFLDDGWLPATSFVVAETLPSGKYDRLGNRPSDGFGSGAYTTALSIYSQYYFWMPNGRILRTRLDVTRAWSNDVSVHDVSVYGTAANFRGHASPGDSSTMDFSLEYSITKNWVAAFDVVYEADYSTQVVGHYVAPVDSAISAVDVRSESGSSRSLALAPAIEYNWTSNVGVILGAKVVTAGRNTSAPVIPVVAINMVF